MSLTSHSFIFLSLILSLSAELVGAQPSAATATSSASPGAGTSVKVVPIAKSHPVIVTSAVGQVGGEVVTSREVQIAYIIEQALLLQGLTKKNSERSNWLLAPNSESFRAHLSQVMLEILIKLEAESFSVAQVSSEDVKSEAAIVHEGVKDWADWKKLDVTEAELEKLIFRRKMAKNFLKFKTESSGVIVGDAEVKAYYDKNRVKFGSAPFEQFKEGIREVLSQQQLEEKLKDWFEVLKRKYRVRFLKAPDVD